MGNLLCKQSFMEMLFSRLTGGALSDAVFWLKIAFSIEVTTCLLVAFLVILLVTKRKIPRR